MKLKLSFYEFIGARLGIPDQNPAPRKPHPASPRINPTSLAREFARLRDELSKALILLTLAV